ncbi:MAG: GNAT family N-acetyltransferase [Povalibacter sp.]
MSNSVLVRPALNADIPAIANIYEHYVRTHTSTFEIDPPDAVEISARIERIQNAGLPYLVAEQDGLVLGYSYAGPYRTRAAYRHTVENSVYLQPDHVGRGLGALLLTAVIDHCARTGYREMVAVIGDSQNQASIRLHTKLGFAHVGTLRYVGFKLNRWLDTVLMQKTLRSQQAVVVE